MARRLSLAFTLAVLAAHMLLLQWLGTQWQAPSRLKPLTTPFFTRELSSSPPKPVANLSSASKQASVLTRKAHTATNTVAKTENGDAIPVSHDSATETDPEPIPVAVVGPSAAPVEPVAQPAVATEPFSNWPADTKLSYALSGNYRGAITGDASVQWQRQGAQYQTRVALNLSGINIYTMTSQGQVTTQGLLPAAYEEKRLGAKVLQLSMDAQSIRLNDGQRVDRPAEAQDTASQFVELGHRFANGYAELEVGKNVQMWLVRPNAVAEWTYDIVGQETLTSARLGRIETFHLKPRPLSNPSGNITAEMWFAPSLQYLPVRIKITLGSDTWVDLMIEKIEQVDSPTVPPS